ncbi:MAG: sulfite exporter TauE/SafE family protein [Actinomycetota bacterium]
MSRDRLAAAAGVGVLAGFLSGLFGVGGGILIVPGLVVLLRMEQRLAHGTSLAAILPVAASGVLGFALEDAVDWAAGGLIIVGAVVGAVLGARLLGRLPGRTLRYVFGAFLAATAIRLLISAPTEAGRGPLDVWLAAGLVAIGLVSGTVAGLLGVGGGVIIIPMLAVLFGVPDVVAKGTSLLVIIPTAVSGTVVNRRRGNVDLRLAVAVGLFGAGAAFGGSRLATGLGPHLSSVLFAVLLLLVAIRLLIGRGAPGPG